MDCSKASMARKLNAVKMSQETFGRAQITNRQPVAQSIALYFMQVRPSKLKVSHNRRLAVTTDDLGDEEVPHAVKIIHVG